MSHDAWEGTVAKKSRGLLDGSNMYRRLKIRCADGSTIKARVGKDLCNSLEVGDRVVKRAGEDPVKQ